MLINLLVLIFNFCKYAEVLLLELSLFFIKNLINSIYDMVQNQEYLSLAPGNDVTGEIIARSLDMIDTMRQTYESLAELQRSGNDYGSIMTAKELEYNRSYWNFLNKYRR